MKPNVVFLITFLSMFISCDGQNTSHATDKTATMQVGDTVSELSNSLLIIFEAGDGKYWFGSDKDGLYCVDKKTIVHYSTKDGLSDNRIRSIQGDKQGNIYISTLGGIDKFNGHAFIRLIASKSSAPENNWQLRPDDLWFSMVGKNREKGPYRYDGKHLYQLEFPKHPLEDDYFERFPDKAWSPYEVYSIYKDRNRGMWFGTSNFGACRYDGKSFRWLYEDHLTNTPNGGSFGIRSVLEDKHGKFWVCNTRYRYNLLPEDSAEQRSALLKYKTESGIDGIQSLSGTDHIYIMSMIEDGRGDLWMATYNEGVWQYDGKKVKHYTLKEGTKDITLYSIYKDKRGDLWLGTHQSGVYKFNGKAFEKFEP